MFTIININKKTNHMNNNKIQIVIAINTSIIALLMILSILSKWYNEHQINNQKYEHEAYISREQWIKDSIAAVVSQQMFEEGLLNE